MLQKPHRLSISPVGLHPAEGDDFCVWYHRDMKTRIPSALRRILIALIAMCALLGHAIQSPAAALSHAKGGLDCAIDGSASNPADDGGHDEHRTHLDCCVVSCAACCWLLPPAGAEGAFAPVRANSRVVFDLGRLRQDRKPERFYLAARGPPRAI